MRIIWRTAMSMDGRLATVADSLDFLRTIEQHDEALAEFPAFIASVDAILIGAGTLRWLLREGHGWPHGDKPTWLLSHDPALVGRVGPTAQPLHRRAGDLRAVLAELEASRAQRVWLCGGGVLAGQLLALDRIDDVDVTIAPVAIGAGPALFGAAPLDARVFRVVDCRTLAGNAVRIHWARTTEPLTGS